MKPLVIYTDGSCENPGRGGWAWALDRSIYVSGYVPAEVAGLQTTNQRMELTAALEALRDAEVLPNRSIEIISDSKYVVDCFRADWWKKWIKNGWKSSARKPVDNRDLWQPLIELYRTRGSENVAFRWVKGHSGDPMNAFVDKLANEARRTGEGVDHNPPF